MTQSLPQLRAPRRSMGLKLLLVCALALLMSIPAVFVLVLISDRTDRARQATAEINALVGGPQQFAGPMLSVPYTLPPPAGSPAGTAATTGAYIVFPKTGAATADIATAERHRGLFKTQTWTSDLTLRSDFDLAGAGANAPRGATLDWSRAELLVGASDARGARADIQLTAGADTVAMTPAATITMIALAQQDGSMPRAYVDAGELRFFGAPAAGLIDTGKPFTVTAKLKFGGAQRIAVLAYAETTSFQAKGDWDDPSYDGSFPTLTQGAQGEDATATADGFEAQWSAPYIARGVPGEGTQEVLQNLGNTSMGVSFFDAANPYQAVQRSLKYAVMFVGLVFLAYFLFETVQKRRVHPAQYVLIGLAQIIFYLLLLSIAERVGFGWGFLIAATATVSLISAYAGWVFKSRRQGMIALAAFTALYGLIYVLMRLEDWALLVGAVTSFAAIAAVMYFTRDIDWYGSDQGLIKEGD